MLSLSICDIFHPLIAFKIFPLTLVLNGFTMMFLGGDFSSLESLVYILPFILENSYPIISSNILLPLSHSSPETLITCMLVYYYPTAVHFFFHFFFSLCFSL